MGNIFKIKRRNALAGATAFDPTRVNLSQSGGSDNGYKTGDKVMYQGNYYVATANNDAIPPTDGLGVYWSLLGPALGAPATIAHGELAFNEVGEAFYYGKASNASSSIGGKGEFLDKSTSQTVVGDKTFSNTVVLSSAVTVTQVTTAVDTYLATTEFVQNVFSLLDGGNFDDAGGGGGGGSQTFSISLSGDDIQIAQQTLASGVSAFIMQYSYDGTTWINDNGSAAVDEFISYNWIMDYAWLPTVLNSEHESAYVRLAAIDQPNLNSEYTTIQTSNSVSINVGKYYYSTSSDSWYSVDNWWADSAHTQQAVSIPLSSTNVVVVSGSVEPIVNLDNGSWVQPASINSGSVGITFTSQNFGNVTCSISGEATFEGNSTYNV
jgi:hypothetical protein